MANTDKNKKETESYSKQPRKNPIKQAQQKSEEMIRKIRDMYEE